MALTGSFTASNTYSPVWYGMRGSFTIGITISAGSNSITLEQEIGGAWYTKGSAKTATGLTQLSPITDYVPGTRFRLNCGTFQTGPVTYQVDGDILGDASSAQSGGIEADSWLTEDGQALLLEDQQFWLLEAA